MPEKCTVLISDLHLGDVLWTEQRYRLLASFLDEFVAADAERLILVGDVLEWLQYDIETLGSAREILLRLAALPRQGIEVSCVIGNHDIDFCRLAVKDGVGPVYYPRLHTMVYGRSLHIEHGHYYDPTIATFPAAASFFTRWGGRLLDALGGGLEEALGRCKQTLLEVFDQTTGQGGKAAREHGGYLAAADRLAMQGDHDCVIFGHTHQAGSWPLGRRGPAGDQAVYINTGNWQRDSDFLVFTPDGRSALYSWQRAGRSASHRETQPLGTVPR